MRTAALVAENRIRPSAAAYQPRRRPMLSSPSSPSADYEHDWQENAGEHPAPRPALEHGDRARWRGGEKPTSENKETRRLSRAGNSEVGFGRGRTLFRVLRHGGKGYAPRPHAGSLSGPPPHDFGERSVDLIMTNEITALGAIRPGILPEGGQSSARGNQFVDRQIGAANIQITVARPRTITKQPPTTRIPHLHQRAEATDAAQVRPRRI